LKNGKQRCLGEAQYLQAFDALFNALVYSPRVIPEIVFDYHQIPS
jgi:hypothetical protein